MKVNDLENCDEKIERAKLGLFLAYLKSPYLEKKLKSLNELRELVEHYSCNKQNFTFRWLTPDRLV